jgi:hypothetical protein
LYERPRLPPVDGPALVVEFGTATDETMPETALPDAVEVNAAGDVIKVAGTDRVAEELTPCAQGDGY